MTALVKVTSVAIPPRTYINSVASNTVTSTTTETAFDQVFTLPSQAIDDVKVNTLIRLSAAGTMSTGILNLGFTFRMRFGGISGTVLASTGGVSVAASLSDGGWIFKSDIYVRSVGFSGTGECQSNGSFQGGALTSLPVFMPNTGTFPIDTSVSNDIVLTAQWGTSTANNAITMRSIVVDWYTPPN